MIVISIIMLTWLFGCNRTRTANYWVTFALYVPTLIALVFGILVPSSVPGVYWAAIPGVFAEQILIQSQRISLAMLGSAVITAIVFLLAVISIRYYPRARHVVIIAAVAWGVFSAVLFFSGSFPSE